MARAGMTAPNKKFVGGEKRLQLKLCAHGDVIGREWSARHFCTRRFESIDTVRPIQLVDNFRLWPILLQKLLTRQAMTASWVPGGHAEHCLAAGSVGSDGICPCRDA